MREGISSLWKNEDWWAIWFGFTLIILALSGVVAKIPAVGKWSDNPIDAFLVIKDGVSTGNIILPLLLLMVGLGILMTIGVAFMKSEKIGQFATGFAGIFVLSCLSYWIANQLNVKYWGLSYAMWAL